MGQPVTHTPGDSTAGQRAGEAGGQGQNPWAPEAGEKWAPGGHEVARGKEGASSDRGGRTPGLSGAGQGQRGQQDSDTGLSPERGQMAPPAPGTHGPPPHVRVTRWGSEGNGLSTLSPGRCSHLPGGERRSPGAQQGSRPCPRSGLQAHGAPEHSAARARPVPILPDEDEDSGDHVRDDPSPRSALPSTGHPGTGKVPNTERPPAPQPPSHGRLWPLPLASASVPLGLTPAALGATR